MAKPTCDEPGCEAPHHCRGLCVKHYNKAKYAGALPPIKTNWHRLTGVDAEGGRALCAICGPVDIVKVKVGWACSVSNAHQRAKVKQGLRDMPQDERRAIQRDRVLRSMYGITTQQYDVMLEAQGGVCQICERPPTSRRRLAVDHDHACCPGKRACGDCVRGLLCTGCNAMLGHLADDLARLERARKYLTP